MGGFFENCSVGTSSCGRVKLLEAVLGAVLGSSVSEGEAVLAPLGFGFGFVFALKGELMMRGGNLGGPNKYCDADREDFPVVNLGVLVILSMKLIADFDWD